MLGVKQQIHENKVSQRPRVWKDREGFGSGFKWITCVTVWTECANDSGQRMYSNT